MRGYELVIPCETPIPTFTGSRIGVSAPPPPMLFHRLLCQEASLLNHSAVQNSWQGLSVTSRSMSSPHTKPCSALYINHVRLYSQKKEEPGGQQDRLVEKELGKLDKEVD